jgi:hypothetical protein
MHTVGQWITNSPEIANKLRAADRQYEKAITAASRLPLCEKIAAHRNAKSRRALAYEEAYTNRGDKND